MAEFALPGLDQALCHTKGPVAQSASKVSKHIEVLCKQDIVQSLGISPHFEPRLRDIFVDSVEKPLEQFLHIIACTTQFCRLDFEESQTIRHIYSLSQSLCVQASFVEFCRSFDFPEHSTKTCARVIADRLFTWREEGDAEVGEQLEEILAPMVSTCQGDIRWRNLPGPLFDQCDNAQTFTACISQLRCVVEYLNRFALFADFAEVVGCNLVPVIGAVFDSSQPAPRPMFQVPPVPKKQHASLTLKEVFFAFAQELDWCFSPKLESTGSNLQRVALCIDEAESIQGICTSLHDQLNSGSAALQLPYGSRIFVLALVEVSAGCPAGRSCIVRAAALGRVDWITPAAASECTVSLRDSSGCIERPPLIKPAAADDVVVSLLSKACARLSCSNSSLTEPLLSATAQ